MLQQLHKQWFLVGLALAVLAGTTAHTVLLPVAKLSWLTSTIVFTVIAMMAAPVPLELVRQTISRPWPAILASFVNMGVLPLMGWVMSGWLPLDLAGGLIVATAVPSTLSSAAVMARKANGDETVSIFTTLITNIGCVVITPVWLVLLLGVQVELSLSNMIAQLCMVVLAPILMVQLFRRQSQRFCRWADQRRTGLAVGCQIGILSMVMLGAVHMADRWQAQAAATSPDSQVWGYWSTLVIVVVLGMLIHLAALVGAWYAAGWTGVSLPQRKAVSFSASQKTLMIGLNLAIECGVNIVPMITYHVFQLLVDAIIAQRWSRVGKQ